ncbi:hypothetical protein AB0G74_27635 [Streptomyces sp. NPDC020875]|uniref:hypothetical protein n=1 Tax=Streptomyces sp. NPDC020875 TaxID=3154898 RepID=UPI0033E7C0BC
MQQLTEFVVTQKITPVANQYRITAGDGEGPLVAFARQKRLALKERVALHTGEDGREEVCSFRARQVWDLGPTCDVTGPDGRDIGSFTKHAKASLLRSTWSVAPAGHPPVTGTERSAGIAVLRRAWKIADMVLPFAVPLPFVFHFDFVRDGVPVFSVERKWGIRDRYLVRIQDPGLDRRLVLSMAVALDALQSR